MSTLHMKLDRERKRKLAKMAERERLSMSDVVRDLIDAAPEPTQVTTGEARTRVRA